MTGRSRYATRLLVVAAIITIVVGLGFVWRVSPVAGIVSNDHGGREGRSVPAGEPVREERDDRRKGGEGFSLGNADELVQTMVIGAGVMGAVVVVDTARRRRKPVRPAPTSALDS